MLNNNSEANRKKLFDEYEESLFKLVMSDVAEKEGKIFIEQNQLLNEEPEYMPSKEALNRFNKRLEAEIKKNIKQQNTLKKGRRFNRAAIVAIIIVAALVIATFGVQAFRSGVFNFLINIESTFTSFKLNENNNGTKEERILVDWKNAYVPTYIPSDFEVNDITYRDSYKKIKFLNKQNNILYIHYTEYSRKDFYIAADSENASLVKTIKINGYLGTLIKKDDFSTVVLEIDNRLYLLETNLDTDEAIKIAENIKFIK